MGFDEIFRKCLLAKNHYPIAIWGLDMEWKDRQMKPKKQKKTQTRLGLTARLCNSKRS